MNKLITCIIGQDCQDTIGMCLESVKDSDSIIYLDGGSTDETIDEWDRIVAPIDDGRFEIVRNKFNKEDSNAISKQRNFYLNYLKENYNENDFVLILDADEVLDTNGIQKLKELIKNPLSDIYSIKMRHLMYNLIYEDATKDFHFVPNRFFKLVSTVKYPEGEHCILNGELGEGKIIDTQIWHLAYLGGAWDVKKRYDQQKLRNNGHSEDFLDTWNKTHLLGQYPVKQFNPVELPETILNNFGIDKDELYFAGRGLEYKHWMMVDQWKDFFNPLSVTDLGCGRGPYVYVWDKFNVVVKGFDISDWAINNSICRRNNIGKLDITESSVATIRDLVTAIDLLEHINYEDLDNVINNLIKSTNRSILVSVPMLGDPNLEADPTHIIKEDRNWWVKQFTDKGLKEVEVPEHFLFKEQLLIFKK